MAAIEVRGLSHRYGRQDALRDVSLTVPEGAFYALLGANGAGKTTLLRILAGLLRAKSGEAVLLGTPSPALQPADRMRIGYIAEGQPLPGGMRLQELESYLAPLYDGWDAPLADELRERFRLDRSRRLGALSRGEQMKAALLVALAPRPALLLMDEPFTGMDAVVKDDIVRGLLAAAADLRTTVLISSHDLAELEMLADHVAFLDRGRLLLAEPMETLRTRFRHVELVAQEDGATLYVPEATLARERAARRTTFLISDADGAIEAEIRARNMAAARVDVHGAKLREIFVALVREQDALGSARPREVA